MNKHLILTAASTSLLLAAGSAMAQAPGGGGFGQYSATAGTVTGCITGATCTTLVSGAGFLQQKVDVTSGAGSGSSFYRTVILDSAATATNAAGIAALGFRNESFVGTASNSGNLAADGFVALGGTPGVATAGAGAAVYCTAIQPCAGGVTTGSGLLATTTLSGIAMPQNATEAFLARGALAATGTIASIKAGTADPTGIKLLQTLNTNANVKADGTAELEASQATTANPNGTLGQISGEYGTAACVPTKPCADGATTGFGVALALTTTTGAGNVALNSNIQATFVFLSNGVQAAQSDRSNYMEMNQARFQGTASPVTNTVRRASGAFVPTSGTLTLPGGAGTVAYAAGDDIAVSWFEARDLGGGPFGYPTTGSLTGAAGSLNGITDAETFRNYTTGAVASYTNGHGVNANPNALLSPSGNALVYLPTNAGVINGGLTGNPAVLFTPLMQRAAGDTLTSSLPWSAANWDSNFGTAPTAITVNSAGTALLGGITNMSVAFP